MHGFRTVHKTVCAAEFCLLVDRGRCTVNIDHIAELLEYILCNIRVDCAVACLIKGGSTCAENVIQDTGIRCKSNVGAIDAGISIGQLYCKLYKFIPGHAVGGIRESLGIKERLVIEHGDTVVVTRNTMQDAINRMGSDRRLRILGKIDGSVFKHV